MKYVLPKHTMKSLSGMGEELCCVYSCWEKVLYPILKPGSHNYTTIQSSDSRSILKGHYLVCENETRSQSPVFLFRIEQNTKTTLGGEKA